jgi:hypothetical protein
VADISLGGDRMQTRKEKISFQWIAILWLVFVTSSVCGEISDLFGADPGNFMFPNSYFFINLFIYLLTRLFTPEYFI